MLFLGDLACPDEKVDDLCKNANAITDFENEIIVLNLEGNIVPDSNERKHETLYNSINVFKAFTNSKKIIVSLANNHIYDYPDKIQNTIDFLNKNNIGYFGLYESDGNFYPYEYEDCGIKYAFFGHCWKLYSKTNPNKENAVRVVDCDYSIFCATVKEYIERNPESKVFCMMHWNYDLEKLPFPMHRAISKELIDSGSVGVIGSHSHRPIGVEYYQDKCIAYCLGNFYLPSNIFFDKTLAYPEYCKETYAIKYNDNNFEVLWFSTDKDQPLELISKENFDGEKILKVSPFKDMNQKKYIQYFVKHRNKRMLVPVFESPLGVRYQIKEQLAYIRIKAIKFVQKHIGF